MDGMREEGGQEKGGGRGGFDEGGSRGAREG